MLNKIVDFGGVFVWVASIISLDFTTGASCCSAWLVQ